jgi:hypothetical protein
MCRWDPVVGGDNLAAPGHLIAFVGPRFGKILL